MESLFLDLDKTIRDDLSEIFSTLFSEGFFCTLVGGATRDFLLSKEISNDLDFEIRHLDSLSEDNWSLRINELVLLFEEKYEVDRLPFNIFSINYKGYSLEFSSPRVERFSSYSTLGHSDFSIEISSDLLYVESFSRRDYTINAIGLELRQDSSKVVDPFLGVNDLGHNELVPCGENFEKDPVRLLRAVRFSIKYQFSFSPLLISKFNLFNLTNLSSFYFFKEGFKVGIVQFSIKLFNLIEDNKISLSSNISIFKKLSHLSSELLIQDESTLIEQMAKSGDFSLAFAEDVARSAHIKIKKVRTIFKVYDLESSLKCVNRVSFEFKLNSHSHRDIFDDEEYIKVKEYIEFYEKNNSLYLEGHTYLSRWIDLLNHKPSKDKEMIFVESFCESNKLRSDYKFLYRLKSLLSAKCSK